MIPDFALLSRATRPHRAKCLIGGGAIILPGVVVGDDAIIGTGSVVTKNVAAGATVRGNPARG